GGGGITPDVFVPLDTTHFDPAVTKLYMKGLLGSYVYYQYLDNKQFFKNISTPHELVNAYTPGEKEWAGLVNYAARDTVDLKALTAKSKAALLKRMQVLMARQLWRTEGYFEVNNLTDPTIGKALEILK
ncbi:MAG: hypothetical protein RLZZ28_1222, partial [Bacteroidota bacterium]